MFRLVFFQAIISTDQHIDSFIHTALQTLIFLAGRERATLMIWESFLGYHAFKKEGNMRMVKKMMNVGLLAGCCLMAQTAASPCYAEGDSPWMIRVRALGIYPDDSSSQITLIGGEASVDSAFTLDLDFAYFFTENIAAELTLTYAEHDVSAENTILGNVDLGSLDLLPPTLTMQYHFMPKNAFRPYVGAGLSYVLIPDEDPGDVATAVDYDNGEIGFALQAGFDYFFTKNWCLNVDVKKVWVDVDVTVHALGTTVYTNVDVDPWLVGVGIGYRF